MIDSCQLFEPEMIFIPAGEFVMGSNRQMDKRARLEEQPQHRLYLPVYYLGKIPLTQAQCREFVGASGHEAPRGWSNGISPPDKQDHPVVDVSWYDVRGYCQWLSQETGIDYRLPSEAEWEKAERGTDVGPAYRGGSVGLRAVVRPAS